MKGITPQGFVNIVGAPCARRLRRPSAKRAKLWFGGAKNPSFPHSLKSPIRASTDATSLRSLIKTLSLLIVCAAVPAFSVPLEELVDSGRSAQLRSNGVFITETQLKNPELKLLPRYAPLQRFVAGNQEALKPGMAVETLSLYKKPPSFGIWSAAQRAGLFNLLTSLSSLTGIQYYSASRGVMRTFYESSCVIDGPQTRKPLPDPVFAAPPESLSLYARQKDLTFGDNIYRYDYRTTPDAFFFVQENMTALNAGIIPAVGKNKLRSVLAVIDCGDCLLIYAVSMAKAASVPGMGDRIGNSFGNRAEAVLKWFTSGADGVFTVNNH